MKKAVGDRKKKVKKKTTTRNLEKGKSEIIGKPVYNSTLILQNIVDSAKPCLQKINTPPNENTSCRRVSLLPSLEKMANTNHYPHLIVCHPS